MKMSILKKIIYLCIVYAVLDIAVSSILMSLSDHSDVRYSRLYRGGNSDGLVILGNSRAVHAFYSPELEKALGMKVFNMAYNGLSFPITRILFEDYLSRNATPGNVLVEITGLVDDYDALPELKQYMTESSGLESLLMQKYPNVYGASMVSKTYLFNSEYFLRTLYYLNHSDQDWINRNVISVNAYKYLDKNHDIRLVETVDQKPVSDLKAVVSLCRKKGINVILIMAPIIDKAVNRKNIDRYVNIVERETGMHVLDLSEILPDHTMFSDAIHTNIVGGRYIAHYIAESNIIKR